MFISGLGYGWLRLATVGYGTAKKAVRILLCWRTAKVTVRYGQGSVRLRLRFGYGSDTVRVRFGYVSGTVRLRFGYGCGSVRVRLRHGHAHGRDRSKRRYDSVRSQIEY